MALATQNTVRYNKGMNKKIGVLLLLLAMGSFSYAQKFPARCSKPGFPSKGAVSRTSLRKKVRADAHLAGIKSRERLSQEMARTDRIKSIFRAYPQGQTDVHSLSGFIFQTTYQGKKEIFGVIAQHATPIPTGGGSLGSSFTARVVQNGQVVDIPAEMVQISAPTMPDLALVKFRPEDEKLLAPLTLAKQEPVLNERLSLIGFGMEELMLITDSPLLEKSLISLRFPMAGNSEDWSGLCGSPVLNEANEVVGTVTGACVKQPNPTFHTGFATRNLYLKTLVAAYHGDVEKASYPLILNGEKIVDLRPDEFISQITLRDKNNKTIFSQPIPNKFPYSTIMKHLPKAQYIELYIDQVWWTGYALVEKGILLDARYVVYDLQEKQIITDRPRRN